VCSQQKIPLIRERYFISRCPNYRTIAVFRRDQLMMPHAAMMCAIERLLLVVPTHSNEASLAAHLVLDSASPLHHYDTP
jgi:hypothetical protein